MTLTFRPAALAEAEAAAAWYRQESFEVETRFLNELQRTLQRIVENPLAFASYTHRTKALLRRFPYLVVFRIKQDMVEI